MEGVELALVERVRDGVLHLVRVDEPHLVSGGAFDRRPTQEARIARERRRRGRRHHVEAEVLAPRRRPVGGNCAHARIERVRRAGDPRKRDRRRFDRRRRVHVRIDDGVVAEGGAERELELVVQRTRDRVPRERRRPREARALRLVGAQQEAVQPGRADVGRAGAPGRDGEREQYGEQHEEAGCTHRLPCVSAVVEPRDSLR